MAEAGMSVALRLVACDGRTTMLTVRTKEDAKAGAQKLEAEARHAVGKASPWIVRLGRLGLVAKGVVYLIVGALAIQAALGTGGEVTDQEGALRSILRQPLGAVMLGLLCFGMFAY